MLPVLTAYEKEHISERQPLPEAYLGLSDEEAASDASHQPKEVMFNIERSGEQIGYVYASVMGKTVYVGMMRIGGQGLGERGRQAASMSPREVMTLLQKIKEQYPEVTRIGGDRVNRSDTPGAILRMSVYERALGGLGLILRCLIFRSRRTRRKRPQGLCPGSLDPGAPGRCRKV